LLPSGDHTGFEHRWGRTVTELCKTTATGVDSPDLNLSTTAGKKRDPLAVRRPARLAVAMRVFRNLVRSAGEDHGPHHFHPPVRPI
jgi:hypothetical protein